MAENDRPYRIKISEGKMIFQTASYKAEKGSVLHSGIYNSEMTSRLPFSTARSYRASAKKRNFIRLNLGSKTVRGLRFFPAPKKTLMK